MNAEQFVLRRAKAYTKQAGLLRKVQLIAVLLRQYSDGSASENDIRTAMRSLEQVTRAASGDPRLSEARVNLSLAQLALKTSLQAFGRDSRRFRQLVDNAFNEVRKAGREMQRAGLR